MPIRGAKHRDDIRAVLAAFREHANDFVFLGGCVLALYARDHGAPLRATADVDCLSRRTPWAMQDKILADLCAQRVIQPDMAVMCRYRICGTELDVDVISPDGIDVGGGNPWLRRAAENYAFYDIGEGRQVKAVTPPYFLATKLVAFADRGEDILSSKDAEDIVTLVVERPNLVVEVTSAGLRTESRELWRAVSKKFGVKSPDIPDFVDCHLHREDSEHRSRVIKHITALWEG